VHLDHVPLRDLLVDEELRDHLTLVALELDHLAKVGIINDRAVAVELLLALLEDHLLVDLGVDSLRGDENDGEDVRRLARSRGSAVLSRLGVVPSGGGAHLDRRQGLATVALLGANVDVVRLNRVRSVALLCRLIVVLKGKVWACGRRGGDARGAESASRE